MNNVEKVLEDIEVLEDIIAKHIIDVDNRLSIIKRILNKEGDINKEK